MGLYDTFVLKNERFLCPNCGRDLSVLVNGERWCDFQTKCLDGVLHVFESGSELPRFSSGLKIVEGEIPAYTLCDECGEEIDVYIVVRDGKFVGVRVIPPDEWNELDELSFGTSYGKHIYEYDPKMSFFPSWSNLHALNAEILYASKSKRDAEAFLIGYARRIREEHPEVVDGVYSDFANRFHFGDETYGIIRYKGFYFVVKHKSQWRYPCPACGTEAVVQWVTAGKPSHEYEVSCPLCNTKFVVTIHEKPTEKDEPRDE